MDGELGSLIQSVLSDPEQMARLSEMAQGLMGGASPEPEPAPKVKSAPSGDAGILDALSRTLGGKNGSNRSTALLMAMRPYMKPEKQEKLDRALKMTQMVHIAQTVMGQIGGNHGL